MGGPVHRIKCLCLKVVRFTWLLLDGYRNSTKFSLTRSNLSITFQAIFRNIYSKFHLLLLLFHILIRASTSVLRHLAVFTIGKNLLSAPKTPFTERNPCLTYLKVLHMSLKYHQINNYTNTKFYPLNNFRFPPTFSRFPLTWTLSVSPPPLSNQHSRSVHSLFLLYLVRALVSH